MKSSNPNIAKLVIETTQPYQIMKSSNPIKNGLDQQTVREETTYVTETRGSRRKKYEWEGASSPKKKHRRERSSGVVREAEREREDKKFFVRALVLFIR